jgi:hypothetical protein
MSPSNAKSGTKASLFPRNRLRQTLSGMTSTLPLGS